MGGPPADWARAAASLPGSGPFQTTAWADFAREYLRAEPIFIVVRDGDRTQAALLGLRAAGRSDLWLERPGGALIAGLMLRLRPQLTWLRGPLVAQDATPAVIDRLMDALDEASGGARSGGTLALPHGGEPFSGVVEAFARRGWSTRPESTLLIDLHNDEAALWRALKPAARKAIGHAERAGVTVDLIANRADLPEYASFVARCRAARGLRTYSAQNYLALWDHLRPAGQIAIFVARRSRELVGGLGVWAGGECAVEFTSVQSPASFAERLYPGDALKWAALRWARANGQAFFDLAGVSAEPATPKEAGIRRFKEKWGGRLVVGQHVTRAPR